MADSQQQATNHAGGTKGISYVSTKAAPVGCLHRSPVLKQTGEPGPSNALPTESELLPVDGSEDRAGSSREGAFNPETGEINWDCPCLGGMAHGTCGEQFKDAFSCFVFSEEEPKGINCVDKFKLMQDCFREHPEEYAEGMRSLLLLRAQFQFIHRIEIADDEQDSPQQEGFEDNGNKVQIQNLSLEKETEPS